MNKTEIVIGDLKHSARATLKKHYMLIIFAILISTFIGSEFSSFSSGLSFENPYQKGSTIKYNVFENPIELFDVINYLADQKEQGNTIDPDVIREQRLEKERKNPSLGRTEGVLSTFVNTINGGEIWSELVGAVLQATGSRNMTITFLIILAMVVSFVYWFLVRNIFTVVLSRILLESRIYEEVPLRKMLFPLQVHRWLSIAKTMLLASIFELLWNLTIIGGLIKHFSYAMIPYITAENPDLSPLETITLSRKMMDGNKWSLFKMWLSYAGWYILGILFFYLPSLFILAPYYMAAEAEFYVKVREQAIRNKIEGYEKLNDHYLYEKASPDLLTESYADIAEDLKAQTVVEDLPELHGLRAWLARNLGVVIWNSPWEQDYENYQQHMQNLGYLDDMMEGKMYPIRLFPVYQKMVTESGTRTAAEQDKAPKLRRLPVRYMRHYSLTNLVLIFMFLSVVGWVWEVCHHLMVAGTFSNRGSLYGPWIPIYGFGIILILTLLYRLKKNPLWLFLSAIALCGLLEYSSGYLMEITHDGTRWWDYSGYFLNLHGRICAEGLLVFGVGGVVFTYLVAPVFDEWLKRFPDRALQIAAFILLVVFTFDVAHSVLHPNMGEGITASSSYYCSINQNGGYSGK